MDENKKNIADIRRDYIQDPMHKKDLDNNPFVQFGYWFDLAVSNNILDANAMTLATSDTSGKPSARIVLLKGVEKGGFVFFTNYHSRKGHEIFENPNAALLFYWISLERQIRIEGTVEKISEKESIEYFQSRPKGSQISAAASSQSVILESKKELEEKVSKLEQEYSSDPVLPKPESWGGYRLIPQYFEFWLGRPNRLHDRFSYQLKDGNWTINRLSP